MVFRSAADSLTSEISLLSAVALRLPKIPEAAWFHETDPWGNFLIGSVPMTINSRGIRWRDAERVVVPGCNYWVPMEHYHHKLIMKERFDDPRFGE